MKKIFLVPAALFAASTVTANTTAPDVTVRSVPNIPYVTTAPNNNTVDRSAINSANPGPMAESDQTDLATGVGSTGNTAHTASGSAAADSARPMDQERTMSAGKRLTPPDQARGSKRDVELTRRIRELLMKDSTLSTEAQNVKIVTLGGVATLSGEVETPEERTKVAALARQVVGSSSVRNDLQIEQQ